MHSPAAGTGPRSFGARALAFVLHEFRQVLPPTIFFAVGFNLIVFTQRLILAEYMIEFSGYLVAVVMALEMLALIGVQRSEQVFGSVDPAAAAGGNTHWLGMALFTDYLYPFELAAVILTVAIIAAIMLTLRRRPNTKHQDPARQVLVRREDRVRMVKMDAETKRGEQ